MLAEKLRALIQCSYTAPRDFYDIWCLTKNVDDHNWSEIIEALHKKMKFKGLDFTSVDQMINEENDKQLEAVWKNSLAHQINPRHLFPYKPVRDS